MDIGRLLSVFQTLMAALNCDQLKEAWYDWGYESNLNELSHVVATAKEVLLDAEVKFDELSQDTLLYIGELGNALYAADDLLDEFVTLAKHKEIMGNDTFTEKVSFFFRCHYQFDITFNISQAIKKVLHKLDSITSKHNKFGLDLDHKPIRRKREEIRSYQDTEIIGRTDDIQRIVGI
ncbi:uncharacterized protein LOC141620674 [Silene latifolia]|uniref:uncharacterized protein LOC141620674 n=1 Tax=Silene latifolia TaxID=37657 RepID=UPI003D77B119